MKAKKLSSSEGEVALASQFLSDLPFSREIPGSRAEAFWCCFIGGEGSFLLVERALFLPSSLVLRGLFHPSLFFENWIMKRGNRSHIDSTLHGKSHHRLQMDNDQQKGNFCPLYLLNLIDYYSLIDLFLSFFAKFLKNSRSWNIKLLFH